MTLAQQKIFLKKMLTCLPFFAIFDKLNFTVSVFGTLKPEIASVRILLCWFPIQPPESLAMLNKFEQVHKHHEKVYPWQFYKVCHTWKEGFYYFLLRRRNVHSFEFLTTPASCKFYLQ